MRSFFRDLEYNVIIAADGETRSHVRQDGEIIEQTPAGGVGVAFDVLCGAAGATYIARGRGEVDREVVDQASVVRVDGPSGSYRLKRLFLSSEQEDRYYAGFANQTLWPLCHVCFERPTFRADWWEGYREVNRAFAAAIEEELKPQSLVWINDYQLAMAPGFLQQRDDTAVGLFWHIPWPTWEIFRILPYKLEILRSLLACDFIAFHRRYQARNFLTAVDRELGARIDYETGTVYAEGKMVRVSNIPMGIDVDVIRATSGEQRRTGLLDTLRARLGLAPPSEDTLADDTLASLAGRYRILLGVDRLDYTKGIPERLMALDLFFQRYPEYREQVVYVGIMSPTREVIPAYQGLQADVERLAAEINDRYRTANWEPLYLVYSGFTRDDVIELYGKAAVCLVTPLDDGMNLVSKEFVVAAGMSADPGMLVLSQFAGSAIDLSASVLVNPYDRESIATAIDAALRMGIDERRQRIDHMVRLLEQRNVYEWAMSFARMTVNTAREGQFDPLPLQ